MKKYLSVFLAFTLVVESLILTPVTSVSAASSVVCNIQITQRVTERIDEKNYWSGDMYTIFKCYSNGICKDEEGNPAKIYIQPYTEFTILVYGTNYQMIENTKISSTGKNKFLLRSHLSLCPDAYYYFPAAVIAVGGPKDGQLTVECCGNEYVIDCEMIDTDRDEAEYKYFKNKYKSKSGASNITLFTLPESLGEKELIKTGKPKYYYELKNNEVLLYTKIKVTNISKYTIEYGRGKTIEPGETKKVTIKGSTRLSVFNEVYSNSIIANFTAEQYETLMNEGKLSANRGNHLFPCTFDFGIGGTNFYKYIPYE